MNLKYNFVWFQGEVTSSVAKFGNSWVQDGVNEKCKNVLDKETVSNYNFIDTKYQTEIATVCEALYRTAQFDACRTVVDTAPYVELCKADLSVSLKTLRLAVACHSLVQYSRACARNDIILKWRSSTMCRMYYLSIRSFFAVFFFPLDFYLYEKSPPRS